MSRICIIAAMDQNRCIGRDNTLAWHIGPDLKRFKQLTLGKPMIMGRKTFESLPGLLPDRLHIVISRTIQPPAERVIYVSSLENALKTGRHESDQDLMVIGGAQIYSLSLPVADVMYLTEVDTQVENGDAFFPELDAGWDLKEEEGPFFDEKSQLRYRYKTYMRSRAFQIG